MCEAHKHMWSEVWEDLNISQKTGVTIYEGNNSLSVNFPEWTDMQSKEVIWVVNNIKKLFSDFLDCYKN